MAAHSVLIADRDDDTREILALALSRAGFRPIVVADGREALVVLSGIAVRLVISELYLPCPDEPCLVRAIRQQAQYDGVRLIAYTSRVTADDREWAQRQGCDLFLAKPASVPELMEHVRTVLRRTPRRRKASREA